MNGYLYLIKNIGVLTLSNFATKILSFFLVPLYTNILTTTEYGTYDLFHTTISVLVPILTLNIQDAVLRFALEKKYNKAAVATIATRYFLLSCSIVGIVMVTAVLLNITAITLTDAIFFFLMFAIQALSGVVLAYVRGIEKITELSVSSVIASTVTIVCNILFLIYFGWGLYGYFLANIIGPFFQCVYLLVCSKAYTNICLKNSYLHEQKQMLDYSRPLIANSIAWWVNSASDRYVVLFFCGLSENGIYSVAAKIPSILNIVQTIFNQAWTLSAVKDFDPEDKNGFFAITYKTYNCLMVVCCSAIIVADKVLASILYAKDFYIAWRYVPWLTIAIIFGALSGYLGGFFSAVKDSKIFAQSTVAGAILNIVLNIIFTPIIGTLGAAIATAISYCMVWLIRLYKAKRIVVLRIHVFRDCLAYFLLICQAIVLLMVENIAWLYGLELGLFFTVLCLYIKDIFMVLKKLQNKFGR